MTRRSPAEYDFEKLDFDETWLPQHYSSLTSRDIDFVVVHHMTIKGTGTGSALTACFNVWKSRPASAHYGVDGKMIRQYVRDKDYAWATGNNTGNLHGISIEHANSTLGPKWLVSDDTWKTGAKLAAYIHKVYKLGRPTSNANGTRGTLRQHESFTSTACPGPFLGGSQWDEYVAECQRVYDTITGTSPAPAPKPETDKRLVKLSLVNHASPSAILNTKDGHRAWEKRRPRLVNITIQDTKPDVLGGIECGPPEAMHYYDTKYREVGGLRRVPGGKEGRHFWRDPDTVTNVLASGCIDTPDNLRADGNNTPAPWFAGECNGANLLFVLFHLDYRATDDQRVKAALHIIDEAERTAAGLKLDKSRIHFLGDSASDNWVRDKAFEVRGYRDAFDTARKKVYPQVKSYNEYEPPQQGPRVDGIYTYWGKGPGKGPEYARPVAVVSQRLDSVASDHNVMTAITERQ